MDYSQFYDELSMDNLSENHQRIAKIIGLKNLIELSELSVKAQIYLPSPYQLVKSIIYKRVREEYVDGADILDLAMKYELSTSTVRRMLGDLVRSKKNSSCEGQISIFDDFQENCQ